jgi:hypothetical protein
MLSKKAILTITTVVAIAAPLVPKTVNVTITAKENIRSEKPYTRVRTTCELFESSVDSGRQVCKYKCKDGDSILVSKVYYNSGAVCTKTITETVKKTQR